MDTSRTRVNDTELPCNLLLDPSLRLPRPSTTSHGNTHVKFLHRSRLISLSSSATATSGLHVRLNALSLDSRG
jgi:hypothetical protein